MQLRHRRTSQILLATAVATTVWEVLVALLGYPYLCIGGCWRLTLFYAGPLVLLPAFVAWRLEPEAEGIPVPFLSAVVSASAAFVTLMSLSIFEEMPSLSGAGLEWVLRLAIVALPVVVLPMLVALAIVAVIVGLKVRRRGAQDGRVRQRSGPTSS